MRITSITIQAKNPNRVNVSVDGKYRFSLDIAQVGSLGIKNDDEATGEQIVAWEQESSFGKLYGRALEYCFMRPHSSREVRDYLWRKTQTVKYKSRTGEIKDRAGVGQDIADRVFERLVEKGYVDDLKFATYWVENRQQTKGISLRKLTAELRSKGVDAATIDDVMQKSTRDEKGELQKMIAKKRARYGDEKKLIAYLVRQGFSYDDIKNAISSTDIFDD